MTNHKLKYITESFFLCSHLPVCVIDQFGELAVSAGISPELCSLINKTFIQTDNDFTEKIWALLHKCESDFDNNGHYIYNLQESIHFSLCLVNRTDLSDGLYIIGPYSSCFALNDTYLFKPPHCMASLIKLLYSFDNSNTPSTFFMEQPEYCYHINKAKDYIEAHYHEILTLDDLSKYLGLNKCYISALFKRSTGDTFSNYTNKIRIEKSKQLLSGTTLSILDIGLSVGFNSGSYYNTIFKKITGMTPLEYRNEYAIHSPSC